MLKKIIALSVLASSTFVYTTEDTKLKKTVQSVSVLTATGLPQDILSLISAFTSDFWEIRQNLQFHTGSIQKLTLAPRNGTDAANNQYTLVSSSSDGTTRAWNLDRTLMEQHRVLDFEAQKMHISDQFVKAKYQISHHAAISPDGKYIVTPTADHLGIRIWSQRNHGNLTQDFNQKVNDIAFCPINNLLATAHTVGATGRKRENEQQFGLFIKPSSQIECGFGAKGLLKDIFATDLCFSPTGDYLAVTTTRGIILIKLEKTVTENGNGTSTKIFFTPHELEFTNSDSGNCIFTPDSKYLYIAGLVSTKATDTPADKVVPTSEYSTLKYHYTGKKISGKLEIVDTQTREVVDAIPETNCVKAVALSPDGKYLALGVRTPYHQAHIWGVSDFSKPTNTVVAQDKTATKQYKSALKIWNTELKQFCQTIDLNARVTAILFTRQHNLILGLDNGAILYLKPK